jgi:hypothetical protein
MAGTTGRDIMPKIKDMASYWEVTYKTAYDRINLLGKHVLGFLTCDAVDKI